MKLSEIGGDEAPAKKLKLSDVDKEAAEPPSLLRQAAMPITDYPGDVASEFSKGRELAKSGFEDVAKGNVTTGTAKNLAGLGQMVASPFQAAIQSVYGDPVRRAVPGRVGEALASAGEFAIPMAMPAGAAARTTETALQVGKTLLQKARAAGYVFPPIMTKESGPIASGLEALGGKLKTRQEASITNQEIKNQEGAQFIGLPRETQLTEQVFDDALAKEGKAYEMLKNVKIPVPVDNEALDAIVNLGGSRSAAATEFKEFLHNPDIEKMKEQLLEQTQYSPEALVEVVKELRARSRANFKNYKRDGKPGDGAMAFAQKEAASIFDAMMERRLAATPDYANLVPAYREARVKIAKLHDLESVTDANGNVNSAAVASLSKKKKLTGELEVMAATHQAFEKAMGREAMQGGVPPYSNIDAAAAFAGLTTVVSGHPFIGAGELLTVGARPLARKAALSERVQNTLARRSSQPEAERLLMPGVLRAAPGSAAAQALARPQEEENAPP